MYISLFFFFQAEDGIRDADVTGVQTCALPISVSPGPVKKERWDSLQRQQAQAAGKDLETHLAELNKNYPLGRIATAEECADLICFLASARASFLSRIAITIGSGISLGHYPYPG